VKQVTRTQKIRLGIFMAAGLTVLVGGVVVLAGLKLVESRDQYTVRFKEIGVSLNGLDVGSPVKYSGIQVGRVEEVRIDPDDVSVILVEVSLDEDTPVAEDSVANLGSQGITGLKFIELSRGSSRARVREPGEDIPPGSSLFDNLAQKADQIAGKVEIVLDRLAAVVTPEMAERLSSLLQSSDQLIRTLNGVLEDNRESLKTLAVQVSATSEQIRQLSVELATTAKRANALMAEATVVLRNAKETPVALNAFLVQGTGVLKQSQILLGPEGLQRTMARVNAIMAQTQRQVVETIGLFREAAENANAFAEKIREDPSLLLLGGSEDDQ
jgi:phospholipid/cholesterol/gamma-HCH transport system substrate-binding protein